MLVAVCLVAMMVPGAASAGGAASSWHVTPRLEHSEVTINGNDGEWDVASVTVDRQLDDGASVFAAIQWQQRNAASDAGLQLGGYGRTGNWNTQVSAEIAPGADFLPVWAFEAQADRAAGGNRRAGLGYRRMAFGDSNIGIWSPYMTFYRGDNELGVSYRFGRNANLDHDIRVVQLRAVAFRGKNQFGAYLARGDYLFDALGIPGGEGSGWSAYFALGHALTSKATLRLEVGKGAESDTFRQQSLAISLRYSP